MNRQPNDAKTTLRILSLNCNRSPNVILSLMNNLPPQKCDILCLQEIPIDYRTRVAFSSPHWNPILPPITVDSRPRVAILVNKNIPTEAFSQIPIHSSDIVTIHITGTNTNIASIYNPPVSDSTITQLIELLDSIDPGVENLIIGDFNKHHALWSGEENPDRNEQSKTDTMFDMMATYGLEVMTTPGTKTRFDSAHNSWSTLDLVLATEKIAGAIVTCKSRIEDGHGSDHRTIEVEVEMSLLSRPIPLRLNYRATDWDALVEEVTPLLEAIRHSALDHPNQIDETAESLTDILNAATKRHTPFRNPSPYSKRWWTKELTKLRKRYLKAQRKHTSDPSEENRLLMEAKRKEYHSKMDKAKSDHWEEFLETISEKSVWTAHRYTSDAPVDISATRIPNLRYNGTTFKSNKEKSDLFKTTLFPDPPQANLRDIDEFDYPEPLADVSISETEVRSVLNDLPAFKAPGPSGIVNATLKKLTTQLTPLIANLLNACLKTGHFPSPWKKFATVVLRKPGKDDYGIPKAYRPIALEETLGKVCESVIAKRLTCLAEKHQLLPKNQFGARPGRTTTDAVLVATQFAKDAQRVHEVTTALFLDISQAFPNVNHDRLRHNLKRRKTPNNVVNFITSFLEGRATTVSFDDHTSDEFEASNGVPQGSPLSPLLYQFYAADLLDIVEDDRNRGRPREVAVGFVDDSTFIVSSPSFTENIETLQRIVGKAREWAELHACQFDVKKFQLIHFLHENGVKSRPDHTLGLKIGDVVIDPSSTVKYLGIVLDSHLRWHQHVEMVLALGLAAVLALGRLARGNGGMPPKYIRRLYISAILPRVEYGLAVWYEPIITSPTVGKHQIGSKGTARKLGRIQRLASILITGGLRTTPTPTLDYHAALPPVHLHLNRAIFNAATRIACLPPSHPLHDVWRSPYTPLRCLSTIHKLRLAFPNLHNMEIIDPAKTDPGWESPMSSRIAESKEVAISDLVNKYNDDFIIYTDGSGYEGGTGGAAVAWDSEGTKYTRRLYLGPLTEHTVYEGEVVGVILATDIIKEAMPRGRVTILLDNQPAIRSSAKKKHHSGQHLVLAAQDAIQEVLDRAPDLELTIAWIPGHQDVPGNEEADQEAKKAALGDNDRGPFASGILDPTHQIPKSAAAVKGKAKEFELAEWRKSWSESDQGKRIAEFDSRPPSKNLPKIYAHKSRREASIITQLRSDHIPLASYLHRIKALDSKNCLRCQEPETTVHYLTKCGRYAEERVALRKNLGRRPFSLSTLLGNPNIIQHTLQFIRETKRFLTKPPRNDTATQDTP